MSEEIPINKEKKEILEDNARKFIVEALDPEFLQENKASSFTLIVDWLLAGEENEKKLAYKKFDSGEVQILLISKITNDGNRVSEKKKIKEDEYNELLKSSILHLEKKRFEFKFAQHGTEFSVKYDEFEGGELHMLEIDALDEGGRESFNPDEFPTKLLEVTGDLKYYGYRVADMI